MLHGAYGANSGGALGAHGEIHGKILNGIRVEDTLCNVSLKTQFESQCL